MSDEISLLQYEIKKVSVEIQNMEKRIAQKKKSRLLYPEEEEELNDAIQERKARLSKFQAEIRAIENQQVRGRNMKEGVRLE
ncbi:MAG TPA: hypothetical protein VI977_00210 [archaeon]|nr:hypothetical protein [archaeon]